MPRSQYPEDNMKKAINAVKNHEMGIRGAPIQFKVPRMTLSDKFIGKNFDNPQDGSIYNTTGGERAKFNRMDCTFGQKWNSSYKRACT